MAKLKQAAGQPQALRSMGLLTLMPAYATGPLVHLFANAAQLLMIPREHSGAQISNRPKAVDTLSPKPTYCRSLQDVRPASSIINRPNSIQLKTAAGGSVAYICESETDMVLWLSALQESIQVRARWGFQHV